MKLDYTKLFFLFFWSLISLGSTYAFDNASSMKDLLYLQFDSLSHSQFEYLFSGLYIFYSIPNIFFPLFNSILISKFGVQKMLALLSVFIITGQLLVILGFEKRSFELIYLGRIIFGYGSESLNVAQNVYLNFFFTYDNLVFPICLGNAVSLIGTYLNYEYTAKIAGKYGVNIGFWAGFFICLMSFFALGFCFCIENKIKRIEIINNSDLEEENSFIQKEKIKKIDRINPVFWFYLIIGILIYSTNISFNSISVSFCLEILRNSKSETNKNIKILEVSASRMISITSLTNVFTSFILSFFMVLLMKIKDFLPFLTTLISISSYILLITTNFPIISLILNGISASLIYNIVNSIIPLLVNSEKEIPKLYGILVAGNNFGTSICPGITALLRNISGNYQQSIYFFIILNAISLIISFFILKNKNFLSKHKKEIF